MDEKFPSIRELKKQLGDKYRICTIDFERCLYRDFCNGFNVEISGVNTRKRSTKATMYLWYGTECGSCIIVKTVHNVERTAKAIGDIADNLQDYSNVLIAHGYNNRDAILKIIYQEFERRNTQ